MRLWPISRTCLQVSGSRKTSKQSGAVAAAGTRAPPRAVAMLSPRGRHAEAGIVVGGLAALAMRRGRREPNATVDLDGHRSTSNLEELDQGEQVGAVA